MPYSQFGTDHLLAQAAGGDVAATNQLLQRHRSRLRSMVDLRLHPSIRVRVDPSDIVQETLIEAHRQLMDYLRDRPLPFYPWLRQLGLQRLVHAQQKHRFAQKRSVHREVPFDPLLSDNSLVILTKQLVSADSGPQGQVVRAETRARVREALQKLSDDDRELLVMWYLEHLSVAEISAVLNLTESAVMMRHLRALRRLRPLLSRPNSE